jgi:hypothetical protein
MTTPFSPDHCERSSALSGCREKPKGLETPANHSRVNWPLSTGQSKFSTREAANFQCGARIGSNVLAFQELF